MSAEVESMFSVREKVWHGLGTIVKEAPTSKFAIELAGLDWKVNAKPIYDENGNPIPKYVANTRDKDNSVLGIVGDKYQILQNSDAFEFTDSMLGEGVTYETAGSLKDGKTIWLLAKMPKTTILGEDVEPYMCFTNSHDGSGAIRVCLTPTRVVCNNTLNLALSTAKRMWSTKHMGDMQSKIEEAKYTLGMYSDYLVALDEEADKLANIKVSDDELEAIFNTMFPIDYEKDSQRKINNVLEMKANLFRCLNMPDVQQFRGTAYGCLMACTDYADHNRPTRLTTNYQENNWGKVMIGHPFVDSMYSALKKIGK